MLHDDLSLKNKDYTPYPLFILYASFKVCNYKQLLLSESLFVDSIIKIFEIKILRKVKY